jgi:hypothetical protein
MSITLTEAHRIIDEKYGIFGQTAKVERAPHVHVTAHCTPHISRAKLASCFRKRTPILQPYLSSLKRLAEAAAKTAGSLIHSRLFTYELSGRGTNYSHATGWYCNGSADR